MCACVCVYLICSPLSGCPMCATSNREITPLLSSLLQVLITPLYSEPSVFFLSRLNGCQETKEEEEERRRKRGGRGLGGFSALASFSSLFPGLGALRVAVQVGGGGWDVGAEE